MVPGPLEEDGAVVYSGRATAASADCAGSRDRLRTSAPARGITSGQMLRAAPWGMVRTLFRGSVPSQRALLLHIQRCLESTNYGHSYPYRRSCRRDPTKFRPVCASAPKMCHNAILLSDHVEEGEAEIRVRSRGSSTARSSVGSRSAMTIWN